MKLSVKQMLIEFKDFAFKGIMIDLAVGVVIGTAFGAVIKSVVEHLVMPIVNMAIGLIPGLKNGGYTTWHWGQIAIGLFLGDVLNFILISMAVFLVIVKLLGGVLKASHSKPTEPSEPTTKECPYCLSVIPIKATKCAHCTAELSGTATG